MRARNPAIVLVLLVSACAQMGDSAPVVGTVDDAVEDAVDDAVDDAILIVDGIYLERLHADSHSPPGHFGG